jgi:PD-(D/E)XK nuclease superfamily
VNDRLKILDNQIATAPAPRDSGGASARGPHRLGSIMSCEKQWALRYVYRIAPKEEKVFASRGTLIHNALAYHYAEKMPEAERPEWYARETMIDSLYRIGEGTPEDVRTAIELAEWYKIATAGEGIRPLAIEREFRARLGDIDPTGLDEPEIHWESEERDPNDPSKPRRSFHAPRLNDEIITCRIDLVAEEGGLLWVYDHKTKTGDWKKGGDLPPWKEENEFSLNWQILTNLHLARHELGADRVAGFKIHRLTRQHPFRRDVHEISIPMRAYAETPHVARQAVRRERTVGLILAQGGRATPNYSVCFAKYGESDYLSNCDYVPLCRASSEAEVRDRLVNDFRSIE